MRRVWRVRAGPQMPHSRCGSAALETMNNLVGKKVTGKAIGTITIGRTDYDYYEYEQVPWNTVLNDGAEYGNLEFVGKLYCAGLT